MSAVTTLTTYGPVLTKRWQRDGSITPFDPAKQFICSERAVQGLDELAALLLDLEDKAWTCIIRGTYVGDDEAAQRMPEILARELSKDPSFKLRQGAVLRCGALFRDKAVPWIMIDVDRHQPTCDPLVDPQRACIEFVRAVLPPAFHDRSFFWTLSGSAGHSSSEGMLKAHLWFWLEEPRTSAELRTWAETVPGIDKSVYSPVQVHYTAAPAMHPDIIDPVPVRSGLFHGQRGPAVNLKMPVGEKAAVHELAKLQEPMSDPADTTGIVGAFCRVFQPDHLDLLLPGLFERGRDTKHYSWIEGDHAPDGVFITSCGHGLVSMHNSAPTGQSRRVNVFDFVRLHLFGHLDDQDSDGADSASPLPMSQRPSFRAMRGWIRENCPEVQHEAVAIHHTADDDFAGPAPNADEVIALLRRMPPEAVKSQWAPMAAHLPKSESAAIVAEVGHLTRANGIRPLNAALSEAKELARKSRNDHQFSSQVRGRLAIEWQPQDRTRIARQIEDAILALAKPGEYISFAGMLSQVAVRELPYSHLIDNTDKAPPPVPQIEPLNSVEILAKAEAAVVLYKIGRQGRVPEEVPKPIIDILLGKAHHAAPAVAGLVTHPLVMGTGEILAADGLHAESRLFVHGGAVEGARPYLRAEAAEALARLRTDFLCGFEFASPLDESAALAGLFTAVQRRVLDKAPGLMIVAASPSSGKTTLARLMHLILTGHDMPVSTFPERNEEEAGKQLLAMLLRSPAMVCFDNITEGTTFRSAALAAALTSPEFVQRVLGVNREARALTNVLFVLTGNNLALGLDYTTRLLTIRLAPKTSKPEQRKFAHPDVRAHAHEIRPRVLRDVVGIIAGYMISGEAFGSKTRFERWDRMVRQPLIWAGGLDVAEVFTANAAAGGETSAARGLLQVLHKEFGDAPFSARAVAKLAVPCLSFEDLDRDHHGSGSAKEERADAVHDLLNTLRAKRPTEATSVGRVLAALRDRVVDVDGGRSMVLRGKEVNHSQSYRVEVIDC